MSLHCLGLALKPSFGGLGRLSSSRPHPPSPSPKEKERCFIAYPNFIACTLNICFLMNGNPLRPQPSFPSPRGEGTVLYGLSKLHHLTFKICSLINVNRQSLCIAWDLHLSPPLEGGEAASFSKGEGAVLYRSSKLHHFHFKYLFFIQR